MLLTYVTYETIHLFKVYTSVTCSRLTKLYNHHYSLVVEDCHHLAWEGKHGHTGWEELLGSSLHLYLNGKVMMMMIWEGSSRCTDATRKGYGLKLGR